MGKTRRAGTWYSPEFKTSVVLDMRENDLNSCKTVRKYWRTKARIETESVHSTARRWERKCLEEGEAGFMTERRVMDKTEWLRGNTPPEAEADSLAENRRLRERNEYLESELACLKNSMTWFGRRRNGEGGQALLCQARLAHETAMRYLERHCDLRNR